MTSAADAFRSEAARPLVVCDIDGVLAFADETAASAVQAHWGLLIDTSAQRVYRMTDLLPKPEATWLHRLHSDPAFYVNMAPDFRAIDGLRALRDDGLHVTIATHRPPAAEQVTIDWLKRWDVGYDGLYVGPGSKHASLASCTPDHPGVLIDNDPARWITVARDGVDVFTPQRPYTPPQWQSYPHVWVFSSWADVVERLTD